MFWPSLIKKGGFLTNLRLGTWDGLRCLHEKYPLEESFSREVEDIKVDGGGKC